MTARARVVEAFRGKGIPATYLHVLPPSTPPAQYSDTEWDEDTRVTRTFQVYVFIGNHHRFRAGEGARDQQSVNIFMPAYDFEPLNGDQITVLGKEYTVVTVNTIHDNIEGVLYELGCAV